MIFKKGGKERLTPVIHVEGRALVCDGEPGEWVVMRDDPRPIAPGDIIADHFKSPKEAIEWAFAHNWHVIIEVPNPNAKPDAYLTEAEVEALYRKNVNMPPLRID